MMDDFASESESDYTSYWRDWLATVRARAAATLGTTKFCHQLPAPGYRTSFTHLARDILIIPSRSVCPTSKAPLIMERGWVKVGPHLHTSSDSMKGDTPSASPSDALPRKRSKSSEVAGDDPVEHRYAVRPSDHARLPVLEWAADSRLAEDPTLFGDSEPTGSSTLSEDFELTEPFLGQFISSRGNEYFCEIDEEYLTDRFNLTGLNTEVQYYQYALDLVTDVFDVDCDDDMREAIEKAARHLYGLVHARYIVTTRGLGKMLEKYKKADFGKCPRVNCNSHPLLPMGLSDVPNLKPVKLWCARCEDMYNPKSSRHATIDGAYFGTSFHNILFQVYPSLVPTKSVERYAPRVFGFKVYGPASLQRWQESKRDDMRRRLKRQEIEPGFKDDGDIDQEETEDSGEPSQDDMVIAESQQAAAAGGQEPVA